MRLAVRESDLAHRRALRALTEAYAYARRAGVSEAEMNNLTDTLQRRDVTVRAVAEGQIPHWFG
jgi:hypothetical protein